MWQEDNGELIKEFDFADFKSALSFVNKVGELAEQQNHHPTVVLSWGKVKITLSTHDAGQVTSKDHELANAIDKIQK